METIKKSTILTRFIEDKITHYIEPVKVGVPKGEPIGFSRKKYYASLFCLTNYPLEKIAETVGVSHGLLRKWRTERAFQEAIQSHCRELSEMIVDFFIGRWREIESKAGIKVDPSAVVVGRMDYEAYCERLGIVKNISTVLELKDSNAYSPEVIADILEYVLKHSDELSGRSLFGILIAILPKQHTEEKGKGLKSMLRCILPNLLESVKDMLGKDKITDAEKLSIFAIIDTVSLFLKM